jgi:hypothetical protein
MGILSGRTGLRAIAEFTKRHKNELIAELKIPKNRVPSYSTFQRVITGLHFNHLATVFNDWSRQFLEGDSQAWLAIDGKAIKGTVTHPLTKIGERKFQHLESKPESYWEPQALKTTRRVKFKSSPN